MAYKWTDGWLCTDGDGYISFFPDEPVWEDDAWWDKSSVGWAEADWKHNYKLKPPAKGKKFYISIQL